MPNGNSFANGPDMPPWARHWEFAQDVTDARVTIWDVMP